MLIWLVFGVFGMLYTVNGLFNKNDKIKLNERQVVTIAILPLFGVLVLLMVLLNNKDFVNFIKEID